MTAFHTFMHHNIVSVDGHGEYRRPAINPKPPRPTPYGRNRIRPRPRTNREMSHKHYTLYIYYIVYAHVVCTFRSFTHTEPCHRNDEQTHHFDPLTSCSALLLPPPLPGNSLDLSFDISYIALPRRIHVYTEGRVSYIAVLIRTRLIYTYIYIYYVPIRYMQRRLHKLFGLYFMSNRPPRYIPEKRVFASLLQFFFYVTHTVVL